MPAWERILSDAKSPTSCSTSSTFSAQFATPPKPIAIGDGVPSSPTSVARGAQVYDRLQCSKCHGTDGRGAGAVRTDFEDDHEQPLPSRRPLGTVDVSRRRHRSRRLHALPHRHDGHADAVVCGRGRRERDVGPGQLRGVADADAGVVDERRRDRTLLREAGRGRESQPGEARQVSARDARLCAVPYRRSTRTSGCCRACISRAAW